MSDKKFELTRRNALLGLGTVGIASAGAGMGTSAYFSDEEVFEDNTLTAGELDLFVHVDYSEDQGSYNQYSIDTILQAGTIGEDTRSEGEPLRIEVEDLKPGDSGEGTLSFSIVNNDAYMWMCGELTANDQNGTTHPEADTLMNEYGGITDEGQLADAMEVTLSYCTEDDGETVVGDEIVSGSLRKVLAMLQNGIPLDSTGDSKAGLSRAPFEGVESTDQKAETAVCLEWEVPTSVGNEIQTDSVEFDFSFYAEQARHNDGATNPCITGNVVEGFGKQAYEDATVPWFGKVRNGGSNTYELEVGNEPGSSDTSAFDYSGSSYSGELTVSYDADSGEASLDFDGTSVMYDVNDDPGDVISVVTRGGDSTHRSAANDVRINGSVPGSSDAVEADGDEINSLNIESVNTGVDWTLTADIELEGLDNDTSASDENPAVYVDIVDTA